MALWTIDRYIASIKKLSHSQRLTLSHGGSAETHYPDKYAHKRAHIDTVSYTRFDMGVILVYIQSEGCYPRIYPDKYEHMRARIDTVSYNRFDMGVILVYIQCEGCYPRI